MIGKKIGNMTDIFVEGSFDRYILQGLFEEISLGGSDSNLQDAFKVDISEKCNFIKLQTLEGKRFSVQLIEHQKDRMKGPDGKPMDYLNTKHTFVIKYNEPGFPVYNSEY